MQKKEKSLNLRRIFTRGLYSLLTESKDMMFIIRLFRLSGMKGNISMGGLNDCQVGRIVIDNPFKGHGNIQNISILDEK